MRITGGDFKGRIIECPPGEIRPTMDKVRESMFSILSKNLENATFLDLFGGSGVVTLEAISRGASNAVLIEKDKNKANVIFKNISIAKDKIVCHFMSAELFLKRNKKQYSIIYCDPPFPYKFYIELIKQIILEKTLNNKGILLMHHPKEKPLPDEIDDLKKFNTREYGRSVLDFYKL